VPAAATPSGNVLRAKAGLNVVPSQAAGGIWSVVQSGDRRDERATIDAKLAPSELLEDGQKSRSAGSHSRTRQRCPDKPIRRALGQRRR
jgi:hypothetical protein